MHHWAWLWAGLRPAHCARPQVSVCIWRPPVLRVPRSGDRGTTLFHCASLSSIEIFSGLTLQVLAGDRVHLAPLGRRWLPIYPPHHAVIIPAIA